MLSTYVLRYDACLSKINLRILQNHTLKNFQVKHDQCDGIIFPKIYSLGSHKYLLDLPLGNNRIHLTGPGIYPQIYYIIPCSAVLICKEPEEV